MIKLTAAVLATLADFLASEVGEADLESVVTTKHKNDTCFWAVLGGLPGQTPRYFEYSPMTGGKWKEWISPDQSPERKWELKEKCVAAVGSF